MPMRVWPQHFFLVQQDGILVQAVGVAAMHAEIEFLAQFVPVPNVQGRQGLQGCSVNAHAAPPFNPTASARPQRYTSWPNGSSTAPASSL